MTATVNLLDNIHLGEFQKVLDHRDTSGHGQSMDSNGTSAISR